MKDFYDLLSDIQKNHHKYLGRYSVVALRGFINGYYMAKTSNDIPLTEQEKDFQHFQEWVNPPESTLYRNGDTWDKICILCSRDEIHALDSFFSRLEMFKIRKDKVVLSKEERAKLRQEITIDQPLQNSYSSKE